MALQGHQGHSRSLILTPIESAYAISYWSSIVTLVYLASFQRYCRFPERTTPLLFHPNFRGVPFGLDYRCSGSEERRSYANYSCNYFRTSPTYMPSTHQRHGRTERRTDRRTTYDSNTALALRASRGKNVTFSAPHFQ